MKSKIDSVKDFNLVGRECMYGSPGYEEATEIKSVVKIPEGIEITFTDDCYVTMRDSEYQALCLVEYIFGNNISEGSMNGVYFIISLL